MICSAAIGCLNGLSVARSNLLYLTTPRCCNERERQPEVKHAAGVGGSGHRRHEGRAGRKLLRPLRRSALKPGHQKCLAAQTCRCQGHHESEGGAASRGHGCDGGAPGGAWRGREPSLPRLFRMSYSVCDMMYSTADTSHNSSCYYFGLA